MMNNTLVIALATSGAVLWLLATYGEWFKSTFGGHIWNFVQNLSSDEAEQKNSARVSAESSAGRITIDGLEHELGIEPDHYLCDRIARINEALVARRDKPSPKKKGGVR